MDRGILYACDVSKDMLAWLKEHLPVEVRERIVPVLMAESLIPLESDQADLVYMTNLFHELDDPAKILAETRRLLKNGGTVMIIDWKPEAPFGPPASVRVSAETIRDHLTRAGFVDITVHADLVYHSFLTGLNSAD